MIEHAIKEGQKGRFFAPPNPWVGCVIAHGNEIVGVGHTQPFGGDHAEVAALKKAGARAQGATAYVTLEPCSHYGKTPPCADALIKAGISKVVLSLVDPDPKVAGKGIERLLSAGIEVETGIHLAQAIDSLLPYLVHRIYKRPLVVMKTAASLDGKLALSNGASKWITCEKAREDVHMLRACSQAVLIGKGTAIADKPKLNVRLEGLKAPSPMRVVIDNRGELEESGPLFDPKFGKTVVATTSKRVYEKAKTWRFKGERVPLDQLLERLGTEGVLQVLVEPGPSLFYAFMEEGLWDEWIHYQGGLLLGEDGRGLFPARNFQSLSECPKAQLKEACAFGESVKSRWFPETDSVKDRIAAHFEKLYSLEPANI